MYINSFGLSEKDNLESDVCIIGAGAAGISLALELKNSQIKVFIVESGDKKFRHRTQFLNSGENVGQPADSLLFGNRRQFGGTMHTWSGRCRPLDEIDFEERDWIPESGWPFGKSELTPYYKRAQDICELGEYNYEIESVSPENRLHFLLDKTNFEEKVFEFSPPTNFAETYGPEIEKASNISILLNANAINIDLGEGKKVVDAITCKTLRGNIFQIRSKVFILAAGGLENTRLLLSSNQIQKTGIGNSYGIVGRYFMDHPHIWSGVFQQPRNKLSIPDRNILDYEKEETNRKKVMSIGPTELYLRENKLSNSSAFFVQRPGHKIQDVYFNKTGLSFQGIFDIVRHKEYPDLPKAINSVIALLSSPADTGKHLNNILTQHRKPSYWVGIRAQFEQIPNPESRITLSSKRNSIGQPKIDVNWQLTQQDLDTFNHFHDQLVKVFAKAGFPIRLFPFALDNKGWPTILNSGKHYMGTTRMHDDQKKGVVDANSQVHGISNLFIASSSVFPTSGQANPTLTIIALSVRLAAYLRNHVFGKNAL